MILPLRLSRALDCKSNVAGDQGSVDRLLGRFPDGTNQGSDETKRGQEEKI